MNIDDFLVDENFKEFGNYLTEVMEKTAGDRLFVKMLEFFEDDDNEALQDIISTLKFE